MQISEPEVTAEVGPEVTRFRPRPLRSREKGDSHRRFPLLLLDFDAILDYSVDGFIFSSSLPDPKVLVLFELSDWLTRLSRN